MSRGRRNCFVTARGRTADFRSVTVTGTRVSVACHEVRGPGRRCTISAPCASVSDAPDRGSGTKTFSPRRVHLPAMHSAERAYRRAPRWERPRLREEKDLFVSASRCSAKGTNVTSMDRRALFRERALRRCTSFFAERSTDPGKRNGAPSRRTAFQSRWSTGSRRAERRHGDVNRDAGDHPDSQRLLVRCAQSGKTRRAAESAVSVRGTSGLIGERLVAGATSVLFSPSTKKGVGGTRLEMMLNQYELMSWPKKACSLLVPSSA